MAKNRMRRLGLALLICSAISLLTACSIAPVETELHYSRKEMLHLYQLERWGFEGRLALTGKSDSWSANITWEHTPEMEKIRLTGPLGQGAVVILLAGNTVTIDRGGKDVQSSEHPEEFVNQQLGMFVPVRSLRYWVVGLPEPTRSYQDNSAGFSQAGWLSEYKQMQDVDKSGVMPHKMLVMNDQVKLKLIIDHWDLNDGKTN
ncbi:MAG: lipoprotein insertase outer membrane protein LolB [Methylobacter sp.]